MVRSFLFFDKVVDLIAYHLVISMSFRVFASQRYQGKMGISLTNFDRILLIIINLCSGEINENTLIKLEAILHKHSD